jgi:hypothetical protein
MHNITVAIHIGHRTKAKKVVTKNTFCLQAESVAQFPAKMRSCLQTGFGGLVYEDFYRVVVQNERFDDWSDTLTDLRKIFEVR